jgi:predicted Rossmann fold nucleotide-binding protein DprA/Smf involved in DNA uptake
MRGYGVVSSIILYISCGAGTVALTKLPAEEYSNTAKVAETRALLPLLHAAWLRWFSVRRDVYRLLGVRNTEELIHIIVDVSKCKARDEWLAKFSEVLRNIVTEAEAREAEKQLEELASEGVWVTPFVSRLYPCELLRYPAHGDYLYPPLMLYWMGARIDPNMRPAIAVVGTRTCSNEGRRIAYEIGRTLARHGFILVTGLAECIDAEAARGALEEGGIVIGVRPWLRPLSLPRESRRLLNYTRSNLVVVSENSYKPRRGSFKRLYFLRNRIIAGMAKLVIVVEARPNGGSMHQIELALKRGKPVTIYEPRQKDTPYYEAYKQYLSKGARSFKDLHELEVILDSIKLKS